VIRSLTVIAASIFVIGPGVAESADEGLSTGSGHDTFVRLCSACHAPDVVTSKRLNREGWEEVVQMMIGRGATGTEAELAEIVDYLTATYPPKATAAPLEQSTSKSETR
jgi:mono/diheme cytochrome c family protein